MNAVANKQQRISIVLPAWNAAKTIDDAVSNVARGIAEQPRHEFSTIIIDDGSTDGTQEVARSALATHGVQGEVLRNDQNIKLVKTLKRAYHHALTSRFDPTYVLRTDADKDFNQATVIRKMTPYAEQGFGIAAGVRWRPIELMRPYEDAQLEERRLYELERREKILPVLLEKLGVSELDPPSCGTQLYSQSALELLLANPLVQDHSLDWGLDFLMPLVGRGMGYPLTVVNIEDGKYDARARPVEKIDSQYNIYELLIEKIAKQRSDDTNRNP